DAIVNVGRIATADRGAFRIALSGGNTPRAAYELLAREPAFEELSWSDVFVYFGDERCVGPDDEQSNYRMARKAFLDAVAIPPHNVHRIRGEIDPAEAAAEYAGILRTDLGETPEFDLVLLGLGPDGHTASLFPGTPPQTDDDALVRAVYAQSQAMWRVTITPKVINAARNVIFAAEGAEKAAILATVLEGEYDPTRYPAQIVAPASGRLTWLVDSLAAGMLKSP
ncbi:MAG TPA: 6-phosphogluconolactonase, partial [Candidatus Tumulicola sp.]|nr:6-phosphogluconolactonase [Candidatus Tumulicola sp.]